MPYIRHRPEVSYGRREDTPDGEALVRRVSALFMWVRERLHRTCTVLICAQHEAVVRSATAHHEAELALAAERAEVARLKAELAGSPQPHTA